MITKNIQGRGELTTMISDLQKEAERNRASDSRGALTSRTTRGIIREVNEAESITYAPGNESVPRWG